MVHITLTFVLCSWHVQCMSFSNVFTLSLVQTKVRSLMLAKLQFIPCFVGLRNVPAINLKIKLGLLNHIKSFVLVRATHSYSECHCAIITKKTRIIYSPAKLCLKCIIAIFRNRLLCTRFVWKIMLNSIIP